jgi:hypothetical protein
MALVDSAVDVVSIVRPIPGKPSRRTCHLIEQWPDLLASIDIIRPQLRNNDVAGVSVDAKMQLAPGGSNFLPPVGPKSINLRLDRASYRRRQSRDLSFADQWHRVEIKTVQGVCSTLRRIRRLAGSAISCSASEARNRAADRPSLSARAAKSGQMVLMVGNRKSLSARVGRPASMASVFMRLLPQGWWQIRRRR